MGGPCQTDQNGPIFSCMVCSRAVSDPRLLPCLHVFCKGCLESLYSQDEGRLTCPTCYSVSSCPPAQLPRHLRIERESTCLSMKQSSGEAVCGSCETTCTVEAFCNDCAFPICCNCVKIHRRIKATKSHSIVVSLDQSQPVARVQQCVPCISHPDEAVKYYCSSCSCLMCSECLFAHKEHDWGRVDSEELLKKEKNELQSMIPDVENAIPPFVRAIEHFNELIKDVQVHQKQAIDEIDEAFKLLAKAVEKRRLDLVQEVKNSALAKSTQLELQKESLERISAGLQVALKASKAAAEDYTGVEVLAVKRSICHTSRQVLQDSSSVDLQPVCSSAVSVFVDTSDVIRLVSSVGIISLATKFYPPSSSLVGINPKLAIGVAKGSECVLTLQTQDANGDDLSKGTAHVRGSLIDSSSKATEIGKCMVNDLHNGKYELSFDNLKEGQYQLDITVDGSSIANSPFTINVRDYTAIKHPICSTAVVGKPMFIAVGFDNQSYVTLSNGSVVVYDSNGKKVRKISLKNNESLRGIAVDNENGVMFVASTSTNQIIKASLDGDVVVSVGKTGAGELEFNFPMGLCLTREGFLLVAGNSNKRIQVLGSDLSFIRSISCLSSVYGVSVDGTGNVHAAVQNRVEVFSITGKKITEYGQGVVQRPGDVTFLNGSSCSKSCYSFVTDCVYSGKVLMFDWLKNTVVHSVAIGLNFPLGVIIDQEGTVIVCYYEDSRLVKLI